MMMIIFMMISTWMKSIWILRTMRIFLGWLSVILRSFLKMVELIAYLVQRTCLLVLVTLIVRVLLLLSMPMSSAIRRLWPNGKRGSQLVMNAYQLIRTSCGKR